MDCRHGYISNINVITIHSHCYLEMCIVYYKIKCSWYSDTISIIFYFYCNVLSIFIVLCTFFLNLCLRISVQKRLLSNYEKSEDKDIS